MWHPRPVDTTDVDLPDSVMVLVEALAEQAHDTWGLRRLGQGWAYGPVLDDKLRTHPKLVPYSQLSEEEKDDDRAMATQTVKLILKLGFVLMPAQEVASGDPVD